MKSTWIPILLLSLAGTLRAAPDGTSSTAAEIEAAAPSSWSRTLTVGYDTRYMLYGYHLNRHLIHADVYTYRPIGDSLSVWADAWAGYLTDNTYRELDVAGGLDVALTEHWSVGIGYSIFGYIDVPFSNRDTDSEIAVQTVYSLDALTLTLRDQYDDEAKGHLLRAIAGYSQPLRGPVSLRLEAEFGYAFEYFIDGHLPNHAIFTLALPIQLTPTIGAEAFVKRSLALESIQAFEADRTYGGLSFNWSW